MSTYVFLGPTLPRDRARALLPDATFLPPAAMGDVYDVARQAPRKIAIIDGAFSHTPAVWHKEILFALERSIRVFGSSSMGALRAAELDKLGMEGEGDIYRQFRDGVLEDDDEVAIVHAPADQAFAPLSVAMVDIRYAIRLAKDVRLVSEAHADALCAAAKKLFYADRTWDRVMSVAQAIDFPAGAVSTLRAHIANAPSLKALDAIRLLERLAADAPAQARSNECRFEPTYAWREMVRRREC